jgi:hypothetical protein
VISPGRRIAAPETSLSERWAVAPMPLPISTRFRLQLVLPTGSVSARAGDEVFWPAAADCR